VGKTANIVPNDPYVRNLLETFISNQQMILKGQHRLEQRLDAMEAQQCSLKKNKKKEELEQFFTNKQVMSKLQLTRQTLYNYRKNGIITFTFKGNAIRYTQEDIDYYKKRMEIPIG
jgi:hypothetical protein